MFAEIDRKIAEAKAKGFDIISLGIGDPDTPTLAPVVEEMHKAIDNPKIMIIRLTTVPKNSEKPLATG